MPQGQSLAVMFYWELYVYCVIGPGQTLHAEGMIIIHVPDLDNFQIE